MKPSSPFIIITNDFPAGKLSPVARFFNFYTALSSSVVSIEFNLLGLLFLNIARFLIEVFVGLFSRPIPCSSFQKTTLKNLGLDLKEIWIRVSILVEIHIKPLSRIRNLLLLKISLALSK